jgi:type III pantothenate kinase
MLLAIDVGNTNIVLGVFEQRGLIRSWRLQTLRERTSDELGLALNGLFAHARIDPASITGIVLGSVVPPLTTTVIDMLVQYFRCSPLVVDPASNAGMPILYSNPSEVGADRIVNAIAAVHQFGREGRPMVICDFGTATTLDAVSGAGEYLGGAICPGVSISADALFQRAARLPRIEVRKPASVIGRTTVGAMESGLFYGYVGMVEGLVRRMNGELGGDALCVATGGLAVVIAPETQIFHHVDVELTLKGLRIVWERNQ